MITGRDDVWIMPVGYGPMTRAQGESWLQRYQNRGNRGPCIYSLKPATYCQVCGELGAECSVGEYRCAKHRRRNPCAVEGCKRSTATASRLCREWWLCQEHWRLGCPTHSPQRKAIRRIWRLLKRCDWQDDELRVREDRIWRHIVSRARASARGDVNMREINRIMGWAG